MGKDVQYDFFCNQHQKQGDKKEKSSDQKMQTSNKNFGDFSMLLEILSFFPSIANMNTHIIVHSEILISMCQIYRNKTTKKNPKNIARPKTHTVTV